MKINLPKNFPQALGNGVLLLPINMEEQTTKGGLIIPDVATGAADEQRKAKIGVLCHVGPECKRTLTDPQTGEVRVIRKGDRVSYNHYADSGFVMETNFYLQMSELDIKTFYPDEEARPMIQDMPSRKRAAVEKAKNKYK